MNEYNVIEMNKVPCLKPSVQGAVRATRPFDELQLSAGTRAGEIASPTFSGGFWDRVDVWVILTFPYLVVKRVRDTTVSALGIVEVGYITRSLAERGYLLVSY